VSKKLSSNSKICCRTDQRGVVMMIAKLEARSAKDVLDDLLYYGVPELGYDLEYLTGLSMHEHGRHDTTKDDDDDGDDEQG